MSSSVSNLSNLLIKIDQAMDASLLTPVNNFVNCVIKAGLYIYDSVQHLLGNDPKASDKDYWNYMRQKNITVCAIGLVPVLGAIGLAALRYREKALVDAAYGEFANAASYSNVQAVLEQASPEKMALLWKHPDFALVMLLNEMEETDNCTNSLEQIPVELLYNTQFMVRVLAKPKLCKYIVDHSNLGLDACYLARCLKRAGCDDSLIQKVLKPTKPIEHPLFTDEVCVEIQLDDVNLSKKWV